MKPELTNDMIALTVEKKNQKMEKIIKFRDQYGTLVFGVLMGMSMIGGFFIWFQFDLCVKIQNMKSHSNTKNQLNVKTYYSLSQ